MKIIIYPSVRNTLACCIAFALCSVIVVSGEEQDVDYFTNVDANRVAFPEIKGMNEVSRSSSSRKGDWFFSVSYEADRQVLSAESNDKLVTQSITPNAVHKRFVFDLKRQRFEPMRQEIRIEHTDEKKLRQIENLTGVTAVKRYDKLGFSIVKVSVEVNPVDVFRTLRDEFLSDDARILTGFFEDEPM